MKVNCPVSTIPSSGPHPATFPNPPHFLLLCLFINVWSDTFVRLLHLVLCSCFEAWALTKLPLECICHANGRVWSKRALHDGSALLLLTEIIPASRPQNEEDLTRTSEHECWEEAPFPPMNNSHKDAPLRPCPLSEASNPIWVWRDINRAMLRGGGPAKPTAWPAVPWHCTTTCALIQPHTHKHTLQLPTTFFGHMPSMPVMCGVVSKYLAMGTTLLGKSSLVPDGPHAQVWTSPWSSECWNFHWIPALLTTASSHSPNG